MPNKGEHSEVLALLRVLHAGKVQVADARGEPRESWLKVLSVRLPGSPDTSYVIGEDSISASKGAFSRAVVMSRAEAGHLADSLLVEIKSGEKASFDCPSSILASKALQIKSSKASSAFKSDILLEVASPIFEGQALILGFSIKSEIGSKPTLLNAGATLFQYRISEPEGESAMAVQEGLPRSPKRGFPGPMKLLPALKDRGFGVKFEKVVDSTFEQNLKMIDTAFPVMLASVLVHAYAEGETNFERLLGSESLSAELASQLGLPRSVVVKVLRHKLKDLLRQSALGMNPGTEWDGEVEAHGGWIVVKETGDVVCFHTVNDDDFREYLFRSCKVETPSMRRQKAGYAYTDDNGGRPRLRLSLQIRFG